MPLNPVITDQLPNRRMEEWRWSDVAGRVDTGASGLTSAGAPEFTLPKGLSMTRTQTLVSDQPMVSLAARFSGDTYSILVPENYRSDDSLDIDFSRPGHARIVIKLAKGAQLNLNELYSSGGGMFSNVSIQIDMDKDAQLTRSIFNDDSADITRVITANVNLWSHARFTQYALSFGAKLTRIETRLAVLGDETQVKMNGAYLLCDTRHCDMTSIVDIGNTHTNIRQTVKGVAAGKATGVFQGKFHVRRPAQHTDAKMRHDALMLSDSAHIKAKPELEIYADDVACAHGNTVGALDESALFYMRQRGLPLKQARALLTQAFVGEAFDGMDALPQENFMAFIRDWLGEQS